MGPPPVHPSPLPSVGPTGSPDGRWRVGRLVAGIGLILAGVLWAPFCLFVALVTANPCGMFADGCDDYGKTSPTATAFLYAAFLAVPLVIGGSALAIASRPKRQRIADPGSTLSGVA